MKRLNQFRFVIVIAVFAACSMPTNTDKETDNGSTKITPVKEFFGTMKIKDSIAVGEPVELNFTVYNETDSATTFLKWQTPFEPLMSKYLDITNANGEEVPYKGAMAKRMMPPPASDSITLASKDSLMAKVDILAGYALEKPGRYTITYSSEQVSGVKVRSKVSFVYN